MNAIAHLALHSLFYKSNSMSGTILRSAESLSMSSSPWQNSEPLTLANNIEIQNYQNLHFVVYVQSKPLSLKDLLYDVLVNSKIGQCFLVMTIQSSMLWLRKNIQILLWFLAKDISFRSFFILQHCQKFYSLESKKVISGTFLNYNQKSQDLPVFTDV